MFIKLHYVRNGMKINIKIREATQNDINVIVNLFAKASKYLKSIAPKGFGNGLFLSKNLSVERKMFLESIEVEDNLLLVAEFIKEIVGFALASVENYPDDMITSPFVTIVYIGVKSEFRGKSIGRKLMDYIKTWAKSKNIKTLELLVWEGNPAREFYHSYGFIELEHRLGMRID